MTITANNDSKIYGTLKTFSGTAFTQTGLVTANGDTITGVTETSTGAPVSATVGTYPIAPSAATGNRLDNYTITYVNGTLTVNPAPLDHHGQQRQQDLRHAQDLQHDGVHPNRPGDGQRRHHHRRDRDQHRVAGDRRRWAPIPSCPAPRPGIV